MSDGGALLGRTRELAEIERKIAGGARVVGVVGLGGIGKTRLALEVASRAKRSVNIVHVFDATTPDAALRELLRVCKIRPRSKAELGDRARMLALVAALLDGQRLLVFDGAQPAATRELVATLLAETRELVILTTSREPLGVKGEERLVVGPLDEDSALALFADRARLVGREDAHALPVVRALDCWPLAIELAASRLEMLSVEELHERLVDRLDVLVDATGSSPREQRTMRAVLDWSWELCAPSEREVLARLSVFRGPFSIEAAEEVCGAGDVDVLETLEQLLKRSLLLRSEGQDGRVRLSMFDTVRAWAREKAPGEALAVTAQRHADHFVALAEASAARAYGPSATAALDALEAMLPELLAAFEMEVVAPRVRVRIALALTDLFSFRGTSELRSEIFDAAVSVAERIDDPALLAAALVSRSRVALDVGRLESAERDLRSAVALARQGHDEVTEAEATRSLGWALSGLGRFDEARSTLESAAKMHGEQGSPRGLADAHVALGIWAALTGKTAESLSLLRAALAIHVEHGDALRQDKVIGFASLVGHDPKEVARGLPRGILLRASRGSPLDELPVAVAEAIRAESQRAGGERWLTAIDVARRGVKFDEARDGEAAIEAFDRAIGILGEAKMTYGVAVLQAHAAATFATVLGDREEAIARLALARDALSVFGAAEEPGADPATSLAVAMFEAVVEGDVAKGQRLLSRAARSEVASPALTSAARVLQRMVSEPREGEARARLHVGPESRWVEGAMGRVDLVRYGPVRRILDRLVTARLEEPGVALSADALIEAGWPDERMQHTAGLLRVYSGIRRLRRLGLESVLITRDDGYLLDPGADVARVES